ncbi:hypothetical protein [Scardovia wiggsiae]
MGDKNEIRVKFEIGEIKFEAEGSADLVERERSIFNNTLLPAAIEAIVRTRGMVQSTAYLGTSEPKQPMLSTSSDLLPENTDLPSGPDLSRSTLASFIKDYGSLSEQDFVLFSAYFDETKNKTNFFTKDKAEKFYDEARRTKPKNISMCLNQLAQKGFIIDATDVEQKTPKPYRVSYEGIEYIRNYTPKETSEKKSATKPRKQRSKDKSLYVDINCDELNLTSYPSVRALKDFKEKMMLVLYIVTNEKKGEWFTTEDVLCLLTDIFGEAATKDQVNGVFNRQKMWFKAEKVDGKSVKRKLLNQGIDFAKSLTAE